MERVSLTNSAFEGNNNVFLFTDGPETVLIDTGDWLESTREQLEDALGVHQLTIADIDRIFLTHWHHDHTGLAGAIQAESGASVHVHTNDAALVRGDEDAWTALRTLQADYFEDWGMPSDAQTALQERLATLQQSVSSPSVEPFVHGDVFRFNGHELTVVHSPGHADGHCLFEMTLDGKRIGFTGDTLLPVYTPNVGGADVRVEQPLKQYLDSLRQIVEADYDRAYPGHRHPIDEPAQRATEIISHHDERSKNVYAAVEALEPCDTWTVSGELFGSLEDIHVLHGPGESYAHLEALQGKGEIIRDDDGYRLAPSEPTESDSV